MMANRLMVTILVTLTCSCSAGDNEEACSVSRDVDYFDLSDPALPICLKARSLSARVSESLLVSQPNLNRHYQRLARMIAAEPYLVRARLGGVFYFNSMHTDDLDIEKLWSTGKLGPVSRDVDSALGSIGAIPEPGRKFDGDVLIFVSNRLFSGRRLSEILQTAGIRLEFTPAESLPLDTIFTWPPGVSSEGDDVSTVQIDTAIAGSDGSLDFAAHYFRAIVTPTSAAVYDMGGEPLPAGTLAPTTLPWPEPQ
jgi:hypothetical protein